MEWLVVNILPVLPAEPRPMIISDDNTSAIFDLNVLYKHIINTNNDIIIELDKVKHKNDFVFDSYIESLISLQKQLMI